MHGIIGYYAVSENGEQLWSDLQRAIYGMHNNTSAKQWLWKKPDLSFAIANTACSSDLDSSVLTRHPMFRKGLNRYVLTYNGTLYNYSEMLKDLGLGENNHQQNRTEDVLLLAFQKWGLEAIQRFLGMNAVVLFDKKERSLNLFRDRMGTKQLYYRWHKGVFCFSSELNALRTFTHWKLEINYDALGEFFQYGYISAPRSIYKNVWKLPPGHSLQINAEGRLSIEQYWSVLDVLDNPLTGYSEEQLCEDLEELLVSVIRDQLPSDTTACAFLSGGIDSSLIAALLKTHFTQKVKTFTLGFREERFDESYYAGQVSKQLSTEHAEYFLDSSTACNILAKWSAIYDEPFGDSSGIPTYFISKMAKEQDRMVFSADGGDELFGGYDNYFLRPLDFTRLKRIPYPMRKTGAVILNKIPGTVLSSLANLFPINRGEKLIDKFKKLSLVLPHIDSAAIFNLAVSVWLPPEVEQLLGRYSPQRKLCDAYPGSYQEQMMLWDLHHYLFDDGICKIDRAAAAAGLEVREPLLDHRVVEFAFRLPLHLKIGPLGGKHILRKILYKYLPRELFERPKHGFNIPLYGWLHKYSVSLVGQYLNPERISDAGILDPFIVQKEVSSFLKRENVNIDRIWYLLAFEIWRERWE